MRGEGLSSAVGNEAIWLTVDSHGPFSAKTQATCEGHAGRGQRENLITEDQGKSGCSNDKDRKQCSSRSPNKAQKHQVAGGVRSGPYQGSLGCGHFRGTEAMFCVNGETRELDRWLRY